MSARALLDRLYEAAPPGMKVRIKRDETMFTAYVKGRIAGRLIVDRYSKPLEVFKVAVNEPYRRQGIATALYKAAEEAYGPLVPARAQSDDAFAFWNSYRPGSQPDDLRHRRTELMGRRVTTGYGKGVIGSVGSGGVTVNLEGPDGVPTGRTCFLKTDKLETSFIKESKPLAGELRFEWGEPQYDGDAVKSLHAFIGKKRVGFMDVVSLPTGEFGIGQITVTARYRRQGIATALFNQGKKEIPRLVPHSYDYTDHGGKWADSLPPDVWK